MLRGQIGGFLKYIFIAGADHSGSTLIGSVLGSHPDGPFRFFHVGELYAYFKQSKKTWGKPGQASQMPPGGVWRKIDPSLSYPSGVAQLAKIVRPEAIIDSSKTPQNLSEIAKALPPGAELTVLLTYRPFKKIILSDRNRGKSDSAIKNNLLRYEEIARLIDSHNLKSVVVSTESLLESPSPYLRLICERVDIPYFEGKEEYWNFEHCHLYGARTQRQHIRFPESAGYLEVGDKGEMRGLSAPFEDLVHLENRIRQQILV